MGTRRALRNINLIVIHCSATPNGRWTTVADIDAWHKERGFVRDMSLAPDHEPTLKYIDYHCVIYTTGAVCCGRPLIESGAHAAGHNANSIGVCLVGTDRYSREQWDALSANVCALVGKIAVACGIDHRPGPSVLRALELLREASIKVRGHRDLDAGKTCPGFDVRGWLDRGMQPHEEGICYANQSASS